MTSASLVAYEMYVKLGYRPVASFDRGYKRLRKSAQPRNTFKLRKFKTSDSARLDNLFALQTQGKLGFIHRQDGFLNMMIKTQQFKPGGITVVERRERAVGYVRVDSEADFVSVTELVATDGVARNGILDRLENRPGAKWAFCYGLCDPQMSQLYRDRGYVLHKPGFGRVMAASVDSSLTSDEVSQLYGVDEGQFVLYPSDAF